MPRGKQQPIDTLAEAKVLIGVLEVLAPLPKSQACSILAGACSSLGHYDEARRFVDLAQRHRREEEE